jgi:Polyketide cyclase / dehydrase and lipid transport
MLGMTERFEVQRTIPADATTIFRTLCDPQGHVAIDASGMLQSASGDPAGAVDDTFVIHMDREALGDLPMGKYDVTVTITGYEQDRLITWEVSGEGFPSIGHYYGYRLEPVDGGTLVTSIYDWSAVSDKWKATGAWPIIPEASLKATLGILERTVRQD